ncbi:MAG: alpha/beta hydrolase [Cryomorphaceae bacterium]|nr:alpha/beta hydrolase [Cryomorphaceae bacterium]
MKNFYTKLLVPALIVFGCAKDDDKKTGTPNDTSDPRYQKAVFDDVDVQTVSYTADGSLQMDIYTPVGDDYDRRAVVVFAHGGSFIGGHKSLPDMVRLCETFARHGYVAASINYRLGPGTSMFLDSLQVLGVVARAVHDGKAAIRYLRKSFVEDGNPFGIDTSAIIGAGNSAGAILMLHLAYMNNSQIIPPHLMQIIQNEGGIEGERGNDGYSSRVHGVINLAGAIHKLDYIQSGMVPVYNAHGDNDKTVPFDCGVVLSSFPAPQFRNVLCGSYEINNRAMAVNIRSKLKVYEGADHCPWIGGGAEPTELMDELEEEMLDFVYREVIL